MMDSYGISHENIDGWGSFSDILKFVKDIQMYHDALEVIEDFSKIKEVIDCNKHLSDIVRIIPSDEKILDFKGSAYLRLLLLKFQEYKDNLQVSMEFNSFTNNNFTIAIANLNMSLEDFEKLTTLRSTSLSEKMREMDENFKYYPEAIKYEISETVDLIWNETENEYIHRDEKRLQIEQLDHSIFRDIFAIMSKRIDDLENKVEELIKK